MQGGHSFRKKRDGHIIAAEKFCECDISPCNPLKRSVPGTFSKINNIKTGIKKGYRRNNLTSDGQLSTFLRPLMIFKVTVSFNIFRPFNVLKVNL
jgi:hypothetical protein